MVASSSSGPGTMKWRVTVASQLSLPVGGTSCFAAGESAVGVIDGVFFRRWFGVFGDRSMRLVFREVSRGLGDLFLWLLPRDGCSGVGEGESDERALLCSLRLEERVGMVSSSSVLI